MSSDQEIWQAYSEQGLPTEGITKDEARAGRLHGASHVWITRAGDTGLEVLLQRRASDKPTWPGLFDISAAGHIDYGETPLDAAVREVSEEIGVEVDTISIRLLFVRRDTLRYEQIIENEFRWVYLYNSKGESISLADGEVESTEWVSFDEFRELTASSELVPQGRGYFDGLLGYLETETV